MKIGQKNEGPTLKTLKGLDIPHIQIQSMATCGMLGMRAEPLVACSPDAVTLARINLEETSFVDPSSLPEGSSSSAHTDFSSHGGSDSGNAAVSDSSSSDCGLSEDECVGSTACHFLP
jgi:hypothetical protein